MKSTIERTVSSARGVLVAGLVLAAAACEAGLTDANINPNAPTDVGAELLLPQAIRSGAARVVGRMHLAHTSIWSQHTVQIQYPDEEVGIVRPTTIDGFWAAFYAGTGQDVERVIEKGRELGRPNVEAVGKIWKVWNFHLVTDLWGDVPYSQALSAEAGITTPVYDAQQQIYQAMLQDLRDAVSQLQPAGVGFGSGDILYGNDFEKWRRFANSLRMRLAMRLSERDPNFARTEFAAAHQAGGFQSNADNAMLQWPGGLYENPLYANWQTRDDDGVSHFMIEMLKSLGDPRLTFYAEPAPVDGEYRGLQNGLSRDLPMPLGFYSRIGNFWRRDGATTPTTIMTYSEVLFLQAEAAARGWISANAAQLYTQAIQANMRQYDPWSPANAPTAAQVTAYLARPEVQYDGIASIHLQKWLSLYMSGNEAWANVRRVDAPALVRGPDVQLPAGRLPSRFPYPDVEQSLNRERLMEAVTRQGGGLDLVTRVWWDIN